MTVSQTTQDRILLSVATAAAALIHVSIAASQIFLGVGIALLLVFRRKLEFPRIWQPLALLFAWTLLADILSPDPWAGRAQIRKFFVFLFIPLIYGVFSRQFSKVYYLVAAWAAAATASGIWGLVQFAAKYQHAKQTGQDFYLSYVGRRITGFESHWMTFGALQLSVLSIVLAHWFFSSRRFPVWAYLSLPVFAAAILLGWTRSIWIATIPAVLYLLWNWRPKTILALPFFLAVVFFAAPNSTRDRFTSLFQPHGDTDSNRHRVVTFRTGLQMIKAHPFFGIGPEEISRNFDSYVPKDVARPLPTGYYGHLHNIYVQYAAERGIPGLVFVLALVGITAYDCLRAAWALGKTPSQQLFVLHAATAVIVGVLVGGAFEYNLGDSEVLMMFAAVVGLGYAALNNLSLCNTQGNVQRLAERL